MRLLVFLVVLIIAFGNRCFASMPCPAHPCSQSGSCKSSADWIVDGRVVAVRQTNYQYVPSVGADDRLVHGAAANTIELEDVRVVRGDFVAQNGKTTLPYVSSCWLNLSNMPDRWKGRFIRVYGKRTQSVWSFQPMEYVELESVSDRLASELKRDLSELNRDRCSKSDEAAVAAEIYLRRGNGFLNINRYADARVCFDRTIEVGNGSAFVKEAYYQIGLTYELGYGVERDLDAAKNWYRKAGL